MTLVDFEYRLGSVSIIVRTLERSQISRALPLDDPHCYGVSYSMPRHAVLFGYILFTVRTLLAHTELPEQFGEFQTPADSPN